MMVPQPRPPGPREASPDMASMDRDYLRYAVFGRSSRRSPASPQWTGRRSQGVASRALHACRRQGSRFSGLDTSYYVLAMHSPTPPAGDARQVSRSLPRDVTPTGPAVRSAHPFALFEPVPKIAQVLSDALLRNIAPATAPVSEARSLLDTAGRRQALGRNALLALPGCAPPGLTVRSPSRSSAQAFASQVGRASPHSNRGLAAAFRARTSPRQLRSRWQRTRRQRSCRRHHTQASRARRWRANLGSGCPGPVPSGSSRLTRGSGCSPTE
jgi:hypothetical protein